MPSEITESNIVGTWSGEYSYRKLPLLGTPLMSSVAFTAVFEKDGGRIGGFICETNTFGYRSTDHLEADILDFSVSPDGSVKFTKQYNGMGGARHKIGYQGTLSPDGSMISGTWTIAWMSKGTFEIYRDDGASLTRQQIVAALPKSARPRTGSKWPIVIAAGILLSVLSVSAYFSRFSPEAQEARQFLEEMPAEKIVSIDLEPNNSKNYLKGPVSIRDPQRIAEFAAALRSAKPISANHPRTQWSIILRIRTAKRQFGGQVSSTTNQGVLFWYSSNVRGGWSYGVYRQDALGPLIQRVISENAAQ